MNLPEYIEPELTELTDRSLVIITALAHYYAWVVSHPALFLYRRPPTLSEINETPLTIIIPSPAPRSPLGPLLEAAMDYFHARMGLAPNQKLSFPPDEAIEFDLWFRVKVITKVYQCLELRRS